MQNYIGMFGFGLAALIESKYHPVVAAMMGVVFIIFWFLELKAQAKGRAAGSVKIKETDAQLRTELVATAKLAIDKLVGADDVLKGKVVDLLVEAGKHLGSPQTNGRLVYGSAYFINWNEEGLALVAQAKALIDGYNPAPRA